MSSMHICDSVVLVILAYLGFNGIFYGFINLLVDSIAGILTLFLSTLFFTPLSQIIPNLVFGMRYFKIVTGIIAYASSRLLCNFMAKSVKAILNPLKINIIDKVLGFIAAVTIGVGIVIFIFSLILVFYNNLYTKNINTTFLEIKQNKFEFKYPQWLQESISGTLFNELWQVSKKKIIFFVEYYIDTTKTK